MNRWRDRKCCCLHARYLHADNPVGAGRTACHALRCACFAWKWAWAARMWARFNHVDTEGDLVKRAAVAGFVLAALTLSAPVALAQAEPGPATAECAAAETALVLAVSTRDAAVEAQAALAVEGDLGATRLEIDRLEAAIVADPRRETELRPRISAIEAVLAAEAAVVEAESTRDGACTDPVVITPTVEPTPTAAPTTTGPTLPPGGGDDFDQVGGRGRVPSGGVATGG